MPQFSQINLVLFVEFIFIFTVLQVKGIVWGSKTIQTLVVFLYDKGE